MFSKKSLELDAEAEVNRITTCLREQVLGNLRRVNGLPFPVSKEVQVHGIANQEQRRHVGPLLSSQSNHMLIDFDPLHDSAGFS